MIDVLVNVSTIVELILVSIEDNSNQVVLSLLSYTRLLRIFRLLTLIESSSNLRKLLICGLESLKDMGHFVLLLIIYLVTRVFFL